MLFTHRGFSGPSVLDLSHHAVQALEREGEGGEGEPGGQAQQPPIRVRWSGLGAEEWQGVLAASRGGGRNVLGVVHTEGGVPLRLARALMSEAGVPDGRKLAELRREERLRLVEALCSYSLPYTGHAGYQKAEVTGGGVPLEEVDVRTMESKQHAGLFFCGEILDVFGRIGGFNFTWAWASGRLAGLAAATSLAPGDDATQAHESP